MPKDPFIFFEMRAKGRMPRSVVRADQVRDNLRDLGTRPFDVDISICRYTKDIVQYKRTNIVRGQPSVSGYTGDAKADYALIEIDAVGGSERLKDTIDVLQQVLGALVDHWKIPYNDLVVYYSGNRGFHVMVPLSIFGGLPANTPRNTGSAMFELVVELLSVSQSSGLLVKNGDVFKSEFIDLGIYNPLHLIRMPNTIHPATGLWKVHLRQHETKSVEAVREAASERRNPYRPSPEAHAELVSLGDEIRTRLREEQFRHRRYDRSVGKGRFASVGVRELEETDLPGFTQFAAEIGRITRLLEGGMDADSGRNNAMFSVASSLSDWGVPIDVAAGLLHHWNQSHIVPLDDKEFVEVLKSAYNYTD